MITNIGDLLAQRAFIHPDKEAFVDVTQGKRLTYSQYDTEANRTANVLAAAGVRKGDRVALLMMNGAAYMELLFGIAKIGAVCVLLNWRLTAEELVFILKDSGAETLVYDGEFKEVVTRICANGDNRTDVSRWMHAGGKADADVIGQDFQGLKARASVAAPVTVGIETDPLFIMYTSGTTGLPKGVVHTHKTVLWAAIMMAATWDVRTSDRWLLALPFFHVASLMPAVMSVYCGIAGVILRAFDPSLCWQVIASERITNSLMVPTVLTMMLQVPEKDTCTYDNFRWITVGGAPVPVSLLKSYEALGVQVEQLYGLTENCGPGCQLQGEDAGRKVGSAGKPFLFAEIRLVDPNDQDVAQGTPGEIILRGKNVMQSYWNQPEATADTLKNGWLHTGDVAYMDEEGFIYIVDRLKDMIISGGENVYPAEIEKVIADMPQVNGAAVIGRPDPKWGEVSIAFVERSDNALTEAAVLAHCQASLARFKIPKAVVFMEELPRNPTGKIQKQALRDK